jgi:thiamine-phosphate pyrophosphorylase
VSCGNSSLAPKKPPLLCYVTDRRSLPVSASSETLSSLLNTIRHIALGAVDFVQIREKDLPARELAEVTREALRLVASSGALTRARILVNDRLDVALAEGAGGVHLAGNSLPVKEAKRLVAEHTSRRSNQEGFLVGASCHSLDGARTAAADGADYIFFGPVFATPSKASFGEPLGLERLAQVCRSVSIPVFAIGGITLENAAACIQAGAAGLAAIRLFQEASDPVALVKTLRQA